LSIGWEKFTIFPGTPAVDAHHAIEMIGVARWHAHLYGCQILPPAAPEQRKMATREMLKALGWWKPAHDDAQSAAQHLCAWMLRSGNMPAREAMILANARAHGEQDEAR
jgi:cytosine/adenosine deaminase-related metal-dependent hydrolase